MEINPFNITKATDFSDDEINTFWVDIPEGKGFVDIVKPTSPMPLLILGGKGSGKTHLMRYFSFPLQKIRYKKDLLKRITNDGYIGLYFRCSGLNSNRFSDKHQDNKLWESIFAYYIELWLSQITLRALRDLNNIIHFDEELIVVNEILNLFDEKIESKTSDISSLLFKLEEMQKVVDINVNNYAIVRNLDGIKINISPGKMIYGIPEIISKLIPFFKDVQFLYLIDEFENLTETQQKYINTVLREKNLPCSFRVGSRLYGIRTYQTFSANEENKEGSEYEKFIIDENFRDKDAEYDKFVRDLIIKRLSKYGKHPITDITKITEKLSDFFEEYNIDQIFEKLNQKYAGSDIPYFKKTEKGFGKYFPSRRKNRIYN